MDTSTSAGDNLLDVPNGDPATYCRLCTSEVDVEELFPDGQGIRQDVIDRIQECTGIQITLEDDYPSAVCWMCLMSLEEFQWFRERCHRYDVSIRRKRKQVSISEGAVAVVANNHSFEVVMDDDEADYDDDDEDDEPDGPVLRISSVQENVRTIEEDSMIEVSAYQPEEEEDQPDVKPDHEILAAYAAHFMVGGDGSDALDTTTTSDDAERRFKCNLCSKTFKNRANLWEHNRLHTGNLPFSCDDCGTTFSRVKSLDAHKLRYHSKDSTEDPPLRLQCKFCPRVFPRKGDRTQHMKMGHPDLYSPTDKMEAPTPTFSSGRNTPAITLGATSSAPHVLSERKITPIVAIKKSSSTPTPSQSTAANSNRNCTICMKSFPSGREMEEHVSNDHPRGSIMACPFCPKTFKSRQTVRMHILNHQGKLPYKCDDCDARFDRKFYLQKHRERYHQGDNDLILKCRFRCKICPRLFQRKIDRKTHTRMVHLKEIKIKKEKVDPDINDEEEPSSETPTNQLPHVDLVCLPCGRQFVSEEKLRHHSNVYHLKKDIKPILALKAKQKSMRPSLNVRRPFKCPFCPKTFAQKYVMTEHTFIHTGSLRYPCDKCMAMFNRPHYLRAHQLKYHGKDSKFKAIKCRFCTRSFVRKQDIKIHERIAHNVLTDDGTVVREIIVASQNGQSPSGKVKGVDGDGGEATTGITGNAPYVIDEELDDFDGDDGDYDDVENGDYIDPNDLPENPEIRDVVVTLERIPEDVLETLDNSYDDYEAEDQSADEAEPNGDNDSTSIRSTETPRLNMSLTLHRCPKCHKVFKTRKSLKHHMIYHQNQLPFSCDECGVQFPRNRPLQVHKQRYHSEDAPYTGERFSCDYCPRIFLRDRDKLFHQKTVHSLERANRDDGTPELKKAKVKKRKDYVCLHCCERFETEKTCQRHINVVHPDEAPVITPCDSPIPAMLVTPKLEPETELTVNNDGDAFKTTIPQQYSSLPPPPQPAIGRPYKLCRCSICVAIFKNRDQWDDHFQNHPNVRPHHCEECLLKRKSKNRKTNSVGFKCQHCPKVFTKANTLRTHQRLHTSELRFPCDECGMMYDRYRLLQAHKDKYHSEDSVLHPPRETYRCMYCPRTFMRQRDCNFHQESVHAV